MPPFPDGFDLETDRHNRERAEQLFRGLWPDPVVALVAAANLAASILAANGAGEGSWSVTMFADKIRLNVGQVETLTLSADSVRFLFHAPLPAVPDRYEITPSDRPYYPSVPVPSGVCVVPAPELPSIPSGLRDSHERYIVAAARHKTVSPFKGSFSPAVLDHLDEFLGVRLPRPAYFTSAATATAIDALTKEDFKAALLRISPIAEHHLDMIRAHYRAPDHTLTASQLARAVGYTSYGAANLHYGQFAGRVCVALGVAPAIRIQVLVTDYKPNDDRSEQLRLVLRRQIVEALDELAWFVPTPFVSTEEEVVEDLLVEGARIRVAVNAYERNPDARSRCIKSHGLNCCICGFNFGAVYGEVADGYIHVHHLRPLAAIGGEHVIDPIADMRPVCPNCHAVIHIGGQCRTIEEVRALVRRGSAGE